MNKFKYACFEGFDARTILTGYFYKLEACVDFQWMDKMIRELQKETSLRRKDEQDIH